MQNQRPADVTLKRIDPDLNMHRFYRMSLQRDLFGRTSLIREWGRIGRRGQMLIETHEEETEAREAMVTLERTKQKRGYRVS
ncbi:WGR domain-containing protein [Celeribacter sp.]|uniref:WGR domain-containing protein n=1 Tax=Celeribacter sp. TaxID=1890673 RepID=UPI003A8F6E5B